MARAKSLTFANSEGTPVKYDLSDATVGRPDAFTTSSSYGVGDYCIYDNTIYVCTSAVAAGSAFDSEDWQATTVWNEMSKIALCFEDQNVTAASTASNICTINDSRITADHVVANCVWGNPSYITSDVTCTTSNGSAVLNGTCSNATTVTLTLVRKFN